MRILHLIDHLGVGGAQTALAELVRHWPDHADEIQIVGLGKKAELQDRFVSPCRLTVRRWLSARWSPRVLCQLPRLVHQERIDVVHAHLAKSVLAALWLRPRLPCRLVVHLHSEPQGGLHALSWGLRRWAARADALVAVSPSTRLAALRRLGIAAEAVEVIRPPVPFRLASDHVSAAPHPAVRRRLGLPPETFLLGFAGRLAREKGLDLLLGAAGRLNASGRRVDAVIIGDGPLRDALERRAARSGWQDRVHLAGFQADVAGWLRGCDAAVFRSRTESLPVAIARQMRELDARWIPMALRIPRSRRSRRVPR